VIHAHVPGQALEDQSAVLSITALALATV
jgi:hypothetical protein